MKAHEEDIETAGKHDNDQRKSCKIHEKMLEKYKEIQGKENVTTTRRNDAQTIGK